MQPCDISWRAVWHDVLRHVVRVLGIEWDALNANGCRRKMSAMSTVRWLQNDNYSYNEAVDISFKTTLKIIMEISKAHTLWFKSLNITHIMYTEIETVINLTNICVWVVLCDECGDWQLGRCSASISGHKDKWFQHTNPHPSSSTHKPHYWGIINDSWTATKSFTPFSVIQMSCVYREQINILDC